MKKTNERTKSDKAETAAKADQPKRQLSPQASVAAEIKSKRKDLREEHPELDLSQATVAEWIEVSQRQYSYFEEGRATLSLEQLDELKHYLSRVEDEDFAALPNPRLRLLDEAKFLQLQQLYLKKGNFKDFWLFGLRSLPVLKEANYQRVWAENLKAGKNYNLLWILDEPEHARQQLLQDTLSAVLLSVGKQKTTNHGKIQIYPVSIVKPTESASYGAYQRIKEHFGKEPFKKYSVVFEAKSIADKEFSDSRPILFYGWRRSVVCYLDETGAHTFTGILLEDVSNNPGKTETGWTFFSPEARAELVTLIGNFERVFQQ